MTTFPSLASLAVLALALPAAAGSNLRPPPAGADASFDSKSFLLGNQRIVLRSGAVHYFRIQPDGWRDRLLQTRLAGFNMVETPVPWNLHQPTRGEFLFDGAADLPRFLDLCHEIKLLVLLRVGPYVNAAVTSGGLPLWLGEDPRLLVRSANPKFIEAVHQYWAKLLPMIMERQVPRGPVALVQVEDHYKGPDDRYLLRLYEEVKSAGVRVPVVLSDLNPCRDFQQVQASDTSFFATTELMAAGPVLWGERRAGFEHFADLLLEGFAKGVDGYNHAMWAAGTNLALLPASGFPTRFEDASCGLLEAGSPSLVLGEAKQVNFFVRAFESVLTQAATLPQHPLLDQARAAGLAAYARGDGATALLFLKRRYGQGALALRDPATGESAALPTDPANFRHVVTGFPLTPKTTLALSTAQVLAIQPLAEKRMLIVYTPMDSEAVMVFRTEKQPALRGGQDAATWNEKAKQLVLRWKCVEKASRKDFVFDADVPLHVVAIEESLVPYVWFLDGAGILIGASRIGDWTKGAQTDVELRIPLRRVRMPLTFYPDGPQRGVAKATGVGGVKFIEAARRIDFRLDLDVTEPIPVFLRQWEMASAGAEAAPGFDDAKWREMTRPEPMGEGHHGWYRYRFRAAKPGPRKLVFENVADCVTVFLNGDYVGQSSTKRLTDGPRTAPHPTNFDLTVKAGDNVLAILAKNWGCYRNASAYGVPLVPGSAWGILGSVLIDGQPAGRWRQSTGLSPEGASLAWGPVKPEASPARWYRIRFPLRKQAAHVVARASLKGLSQGVLWINGHFAGLYSQTGTDAAVGYYLPGQWLRDENELVVLEEGGKQPAEAEIRFDRSESYFPLRIAFTAQ